MMKKPQLVFSVGCLLLLMGLSIFSVQAQETWFAYLYNDFERTLLRVDQNGNQTTFALNIPEEAYVSGWDMTFSHDGSLVGYCESVFSGDSAFSQTRFTVHDLNAGAPRFQVDLGQTIGCASTQESFSPDGSLVAVSTVNFFADNPPPDPNIPFWQLRLLDTNTGAIVHELNSFSDIVPTTNLTADAPVMTEVRYFDDDEVIFAELRWDIFSGVESQAYRWNYLNNTLSPIIGYGNDGADSLDGIGELVWTALDDSRPAGDMGAGFAGNNVVQISDVNGEGRTIFSTSDFVILDTVFINNGRQVAMLMLPPFDPNNLDAELTLTWLALNRDGTVTTLQEGVSTGEIAPAPNGYAIFDVVYSGADFSQADLSLTYYQDSNSTILWQSNQDGWQLVWATPTTTASDLTSFPTLP